MKRIVFCASALLTLIACSGVPDPSPTETASSTMQLLVDPGSVLGFENAAEWTSTQGLKSSSSTRSQGAASLAISNFSYTAVISTPLSTLSGVTSTIGLDVRLPVTVPWGQVQLFYSIPSKNLYEQPLGQVSLMGVPAGSFRTLNFSVPAGVQQHLQSSYNDLTFKVAVNAPQTSNSILLDNLRFISQSIQADKIEIEVTSADDAVVALVDGLRRGSWALNDPRFGMRVNVSHWFASGSHSLRLLASNTGGPTAYGVRVWADNALVYEAQCPATVCNGSNRDAAIELDKSLQFSTPTHPAAQTVQITGSASGKVYLDNAFTGLSTTGTSSPVTLSLPQGSYTLGMGVSADTPPNYTGQYHEQQVTVGSSGVNVNLSGAPQLGVQDTARVVVVPIRHVIFDPTGQTGNLTNEDITSFQAQVAATRTQWLLPFSYGLNDWNVTWQPTVENVPVHVRAAGQGIDTDPFLCEAGLTSLRSNYDIVVYLWNLYDDSGAEFGADASAYGGGGQVWMNTYWTRRTDWPHTGPNPALLHEVLHNYEQYNAGVLRNYNGIQELHGGTQHGYYVNAGGELDFARWMRAYIRGQVAELVTMRQSVNWPAPPTNADLWVGVFATVRRGYSPSPWTPPTCNVTGIRSATKLSAPISSTQEIVRCPAP
ncbi:MAG TPA: hypothetical protein VJV79_09390 [Polyangiaceae bacterium]|nr:hypothetical protein [Polyangiaceae bacterium]